MRAYSIDLRQRIVQAVEEGTSKSAAARTFHVGLATVKRYMAQHAQTGELAPKTIPGRPPRIRSEQWPALLVQLRATPDATLAEHCEEWERTQHVRVSIFAMRPCVAPSSGSSGHEKKVISASEQDPVVRQEYRENTASLPHEDFVFIDETHATIGLTRLYARAPRNERARGSVPRNYGHVTTLVGALSVAGMGAAMTIQGAVDTAAFNVYVRDILCPSLRPGQIVVMDNLSVHKGRAVREWIEAAHCSLLFLPPYSPDFSPIEPAFSKVREALRAAGARTQSALDEAISTTLDAITPEDAIAWFRYCGYLASSN